jgi:hypothetical protein
MRRNQEHAKIIIGGVDYSKYMSFPFVFQDTGTEQLDSAIVTLNGMPTEARFRPFTAVSLCGGKYTYVVADDSVRAVYGRNLWNHELTLIDETKATERILMEAKSFTQPLKMEYGQAKSADCYRFELDSSGDIEEATQGKVESVLTPTNGSVVTIPPPASLVGILGGLYSGEWDIAVLYSPREASLTDDNDGFETVYTATGVNDQRTDSFQPVKTGVYTIKYSTVFDTGIGTPTKNRYIIPVVVYSDAEKESGYSVYDVLTILLETAQPLMRKADAPSYTLDLTADQAERYKNTAAPELHFENGRSLYENLKAVGEYVHAIPKVKNGKVRFQDLGYHERADMSNGVLYGGQANYNAAEYATAVEANFANLVNASDESEGSVTEPYTGGRITLRSNSYRIKEEDSYIPTAFPISTKVKKVLAFYQDGDEDVEIDITPAVFEKNEYDLLSGFSGVYPHSKTHALYYVTGQKNIEGLWYRAQDSEWGTLNAFQKYAITNVLNHFGNRNDDEYDYTKLSFMVTYIPFINGRARQERTEDVNGSRIVLAHNQSANELSARAFGENLRGRVAMLGNATESLQYLFPSVNDLPIGGTMYDKKKFITLVTTRVFPDYCLSQIDLSENYNNAGAFVQMKTGIRQYEIPTGKDRCTLLEEYCVIGKAERSPEDYAQALYLLCQPLMREKTLSAFNGASSPCDITSVSVKTYDEDLNAISPRIVLPVYSTSLGSSVYFGFSFEDNYSAGKSSVYIGKSAARGTQYIEYGTPYYARAKYLGFTFTDGYDDTSLAIANALPLGEKLNPIEKYITNDIAGLLIWNKDSADIGNVAYQLHFCTNDGYVIGSELARMMPYVRTAAEYIEKPVAVFYDTEIDELTGNASATAKTVATSEITVDAENECIRINALPSKAYKSFVIKREGGECIIGKNTESAENTIYFNFKRKR